MDAMDCYAAIRDGNLVFARQILRAEPSLLAEKALGRTWLHYAAENGDLGFVSELIQAGLDVNAPMDNTPLTPLDCAARTGSLPLVELLLKSGAKVRQSTPDAGGTLIPAINGGSIAIVKLLLSLGADPSVVFGPYLHTAISHAEAIGRNDIAAILRLPFSSAQPGGGKDGV